MYLCLNSFTTAQADLIDNFNYDFRRFSSFSEAQTQLFRIGLKF